MARPHRFTVRLSKNEISAINSYADQTHLIPSVAVRILLTRALAGNHKGQTTSGTIKEASLMQSLTSIS